MIRLQDYKRKLLQHGRRLDLNPVVLREHMVTMVNRFFSGGPIENRSKKYFLGQISKKNKIFRKSGGRAGGEDFWISDIQGCPKIGFL